MAEARPSILRMATGSMQPTIAVGDLLLAVPCPGRLPRPGEIWVFPPNGGIGETYAHRVTRVFRRDGVAWVSSLGDANGTVEDPPVRADSALARVVAVGRELGRRPSRIPAALAAIMGRWILSGRASRLTAVLTRAYAALSARPGRAARLARRALISASLAHDELTDSARSTALVDIACAALQSPPI